MLNKEQLPRSDRKSYSMVDRIFGILGGTIAGLVVSVIVFTAFFFFSGSLFEELTLLTFAGAGSVTGSVIGLVFPKQMAAIGSFLGNLIPGI
jgi:membrane protein DedA with SNARE-associated domain